VYEDDKVIEQKKRVEDDLHIDERERGDSEDEKKEKV
jgi:hypothetical protein